MEPPALLVLRACRVRLERPVLREQLATLARRVYRARLVPPEHRVRLALRDQPVLLGIPVQRAHRAIQVLLVPLAPLLPFLALTLPLRHLRPRTRRVTLEILTLLPAIFTFGTAASGRTSVKFRDRLALLDPRELRAIRDRPVRRVLLVILVQRDRKVSLARLARLDLRVRWDRPELLERRAIQVLLEQPVTLVLRVLRVFRVRLDLRVP